MRKKDEDSEGIPLLDVGAVETPLGRLFYIYFSKRVFMISRNRIEIDILGRLGSYMEESGVRYRLNWLDIKLKPLRSFDEAVSAYFDGKELQHPYRLFVCRSHLPIFEAIKRIPRGETATYREIARGVGTNPRIVGQALRNNPLPLLIPCHRVVRSDGSLGGYMWGGHLKLFLLQLEGADISSLRF